MSTGVTFLEMANIIQDYYGAGDDAWLRFVNARTPEEINSVIRQVPGASVTWSKDYGRVLGYDYENPFPETPNPAASGNSNVPNASYGRSSFSARVNGSFTWDGDPPTTGRLTSGARRVSTGTRVATVAGKLNVATTAVAAGMFLGAKIDSALYNIGKFFDLNPPESLNPETWDSIATTEGGKSLIRHLFDIGDDGQTTAYMPEDALEYMYRYWLEQGMFSTGGVTSTVSDAEYTQLNNPNVPKTVTQCNNNTVGYRTSYFRYDVISGSDVKTAAYGPSSVDTGQFNKSIVFASNNPFILRRYTSTNGSTWTSAGDYYGQSRTVLDKTFYMEYSGDYFRNIAGPMTITTGGTGTTNSSTIGYILTKGTQTIEPTIDGVTPDPNASERPDPSQIDPSQPLLPQLKQQMPNTFNNPIKETVPQPDGTTRDIIYYPVPWPKITDDTDEPTTGERNQDDPTVTPESPSDETSPLVDVITNPNPQPTTPTPGPPASPPDTGSGSTPTVVPPTGNASSLWAIYNPTQSQLDAFGSWLWSSDFVEQIKKLFNDPMQAIVGVHKVFATPSTSGQVNIKCGYIDSGCPAARVSSQYTTIDCGTVSVREYYGNIFDYSPYTEISLYLPFIGIVKLDTADVMRGSVQVKYHVDVITGACLADVIVKRDGENAVMYQYSGSAIVTYPISSGSYASMVTGILSLAAGVAGTIMTGGAAAPALIGGAVGLSHLHTDVQKSGGFSGSPGAMGCKKPYLIISRAQDALPADFEKYEGKPASKTVQIGDCDGFIRVKQINIDGVPATYGELDQIVSLLKQGVIV